MKEEKDCECCESEHYELCGNLVDAFAIIGKKWNGIIISTLCSDAKMRFRDLANAIEPCSDRVLVERLRELESAGIVDRFQQPDCKTVRYSLTEKGQALKPVMQQVHVWADQWA